MIVVPSSLVCIAKRIVSFQNVLELLGSVDAWVLIWMPLEGGLLVALDRFKLVVLPSQSPSEWRSFLRRAIRSSKFS